MLIEPIIIVIYAGGVFAMQDCSLGFFARIAWPAFLGAALFKWSMEQCGYLE